MPISEEKKPHGTFNGYFLFYDCPFCGKPKTMDGPGQSIIWVAQKCIANGFAISSCNRCGKHFKNPKEIFSEGVLDKFKEATSLPGDQLYNYVDKTYLKNCTQMKMLRPDWFEIMVEANGRGPVDVLSMPWDSREDCPNCGSRYGGYPVSVSYACPNCRHKIIINQEDIDQKLGVKVLCRYCMKSHFVPPTAWCTKCNRGLLDYYDILRVIAKTNDFDFEKLNKPFLN
jgi:hypothetical protein